MLNKALAIDPRVGLFLPCRVTLIEKDNKVSMITINPAAMSQQFNNDELNKLCEEMTALYEEILEEAAL
jgi:cytochrome c oxidase cbb3-type subunit 3